MKKKPKLSPAVKKYNSLLRSLNRSAAEVEEQRSSLEALKAQSAASTDEATKQKLDLEIAELEKAVSDKVAAGKKKVERLRNF